MFLTHAIPECRIAISGPPRSKRTNRNANRKSSGTILRLSLPHPCWPTSASSPCSIAQPIKTHVSGGLSLQNHLGMLTKGKHIPRMKAPDGQPTTSAPETVLSNAEIVDRLASLAQLLSAQKENPYKVKAYRRAAAKIRTLSESIDELVRNDADRSFLLPAHDEHPGFFLQIVHF